LPTILYFFPDNKRQAGKSSGVNILSAGHFSFRPEIHCVGGSVFKHQHRVLYRECTVGNHVYYSRYLEMLEGARGEFFRHLGCPFRGLQEAGTAFPVIGLEIAYKEPARYDDLLMIELCVKELRGVRVNFAFRILNESGALLVEGETRHVCAALDEKPRRMPGELLEKLQPFLHSSHHAS
jgi:acyl-CoA thioester hydrolase